MPRWFGLLLLASGCPGTTPVPVDTDTGSDTDVTPDTDVYETGWLGETDTDVDTDVDTDAHTDTDTDTQADTDTGVVVGDTARCPYGEIPDCAGTCYPSYFLGDGMCDDGLVTASDFSCVNYRLDEGDCGQIGPGPASCDYVLRLTTRGYENEVGWRILDAQGVVLYRVAPGTYTESLRAYDHPIALPDGDFTMVMVDSFGDGWNAGKWELIRPTSGEVIASGSLADDPEEPDLIPILQEESIPFSVTCATVGAPECDMGMTLSSGTRGDELAYEVRAASGYVLYRGAAGMMGDNEVLQDTLRLASGVYTFRMTDAGRNGWQGGHVEVAYPGGYVAGFGTLTGFQVGSFQLAVDCDNADAPPIPRPTEVFPIRCADAQIVINAQSDGPELAFTLHDATTWAQITSRDPGVFFGNVQSTVNAPLPHSGTYALILRDAIGDGWAGSTLTVRDRSSGRDLFTSTLPWGFNTLTRFDVQCVDQAADTAPPEPQDCPTGAITDCDGVCWPATYKGDCHCDDGTLFAPNFACTAHSNDNGDCDDPPPRRCR
ncbi:MAG TPA: hypothetical protein PKA64_18385 [Myxococcota bacterium]|nr:hypothetical protein [Myxococcota bacterium]